MTKKLLAIIICLAMVLTLAACKKDDDTSLEKKTTEESTEVSVPEEVASSKTFAIFDVFNSDRYSMKAPFSTSARVEVHRDAENFYMFVEVLGVKACVLVTGGKTYLYDEDQMLYDVRDIPSEKLDSIVKQFSDLFAVSPEEIEGLVLSETGMAEFQGRELFYEDFKASENAEEAKRFFFDGDDLIGVETVDLNTGNKTESRFFISANVPEDAFKVREGYTKDESGELYDIFNRMFAGA